MEADFFYDLSFFEGQQQLQPEPELLKLILSAGGISTINSTSNYSPRSLSDSSSSSTIPSPTHTVPGADLLISSTWTPNQRDGSSGDEQPLRTAPNSASSESSDSEHSSQVPNLLDQQQSPFQKRKRAGTNSSPFIALPATSAPIALEASSRSLRTTAANHATASNNKNSSSSPPPVREARKKAKVAVKDDFDEDDDDFEQGHSKKSMNKEAANRYRQKKKLQFIQLKEDCETLKTEKSQLQAQNETLQQEVAFLKSIMMIAVKGLSENVKQEGSDLLVQQLAGVFQSRDD